MVFDGAAHFGEHAVAEEVAEVVIDFLEAVGVDEQHGRLVVVGNEPVDAVLHLRDGGFFAQEAREAVAVGFRLHAHLPELLRLDAAEVAVGDGREAVFEECDDVYFGPEIAAAVMADAELAARFAHGEIRLARAEDGVEVGVQNRAVLRMDELFRPEHRRGLRHAGRQFAEAVRDGLVQRHAVAREIPLEIEMLVEVVKHVEDLF